MTWNTLGYGHRQSAWRQARRRRGGTRFYLAQSTVAAVTPVRSGTWTNVSALLNRAMSITKLGQGIVTNSVSWTAGEIALDRCYVSAPLAAQTVSGTVTVMAISRESAETNNAFIQFEAYVVSNDGSTVRGSLLTIGNYGSGTELIAASSRTKIWANNTALSSVVCSAGDRLVACFGYTDSSGVAPIANTGFGDAATLDIPNIVEEEVFTVTTRNPWVDFSQVLIFQ